MPSFRKDNVTPTLEKRKKERKYISSIFILRIDFKRVHDVNVNLIYNSFNIVLLFLTFGKMHALFKKNGLKPIKNQIYNLEDSVNAETPEK